MRKIITRASLPARVFEWNPQTTLRLAELLLEGNPLALAVDLLGIEFGRIEQRDAVRLVLEAGGVLPFICEQVPSVSRNDIARMQALYHHHDGRRKGGRRTAQKDRQRSALSRLASYDVYDEGVEERFTRILKAMRNEDCIVPHVYLMRGASLLREALDTKSHRILVSCLTIRAESPKGRKTNKKRQEVHALFVARLMREIVELRINPDTEFGGALAQGGFRKVILQVMEYTYAKGPQGFVAIESALLDVVLRLK